MSSARRASLDQLVMFGRVAADQAGAGGHRIAANAPFAAPFGGILSWLSAVPSLLTAAGLIFLPGVAVAYSLRFKGFTAVVLAPLFSTAVVGFFGIVANWIGISWSVGVYASTAAVTAFLALALTHWSREQVSSAEDVSRWRAAWHRLGLPLAASGLGGAVIMAGMMKLIGRPDHMSQVFDNVFHLNAVRYIIEIGNASSLTLGSSQGRAPLYPAAWHTFAAICADLTGTSVQVAENNVNLIIAAVVWPLGCVFLARTLFGNAPAVTLTAGILSAAQPAFPYMLYVWGPLFPNALSVSLLPAAMAIAVVLLRAAAPAPHLLSWALALLLGLAGIGLAHPTTVIALLLFTMPLIVVTLVRQWRARRTTKNTVLLAILTSLTATIAAITWVKLRPPRYDNWGPHGSTAGAIREALTNAPFGTETNWIVTPLALYGVVVVIRTRRQRWFVMSYGIAVFLYVVDAAMPQGTSLRDFLTGTWYQDTFRLAAFLPLFATAIAAAGAQDAFHQIRAAYRRIHPPLREGADSSSPYAVTGIALAVLAFTCLSYMGPPRMYLANSYFAYRFDGQSAILTPNKLAFIDRLDHFVEPGAVIADNPWNGSSLAYAFGNRRVLTPHLLADTDNERVLLSHELGVGNFSPEVCAAVKSKNVRYILDFGHRYIFDAAGARDYPGVTDVIAKPGIELVAQHGRYMRLFRVTGCDH
jgi:hypothetical protein